MIASIVWSDADQNLSQESN